MTAAGIGALHTSLAHWNVMVDNTQVFPGGPPVVKAALGYDITKEDLGGPHIHVRESGVVDNLAASDVVLSAEQARNASLISAISIRRGMPAHAATIALATALQESKLYNLRGGDRDSLGLFQQRHSQGWGTPQQIMTSLRTPGASVVTVLTLASAIAGLIDLGGITVERARVMADRRGCRD